MPIPTVFGFTHHPFPWSNLSKLATHKAKRRQRPWYLQGTPPDGLCSWASSQDEPTCTPARHIYMHGHTHVRTHTCTLSCWNMCMSLAKCSPPPLLAHARTHALFKRATSPHKYERACLHSCLHMPTHMPTQMPTHMPTRILMHRCERAAPTIHNFNLCAHTMGLKIASLSSRA